MRLVRKFVLALLIFLVLALTWYANTLLSLARPQLLAANIIQPAAELVAPAFRYERLGIEVPVTVSAETSPLTYRDWSVIRQSLAAGVSLAFEGEQFDAAALAFLTGHSSDTYPHAYSSVFAPLGQAKVGDTFELALDGSRILAYRVVETKRLSPRDAHAFRALGIEGQHRVVLVTCWPVLTTNQRLVVVGEQENQ